MASVKRTARTRLCGATLVGERGWPAGDYTERAVRSVLSGVVSSAA
jgi:hypothetical protein